AGRAVAGAAALPARGTGAPEGARDEARGGDGATVSETDVSLETTPASSPAPPPQRAAPRDRGRSRPGSARGSRTRPSSRPAPPLRRGGCLCPRLPAGLPAPAPWRDRRFWRATWWRGGAGPRPATSWPARVRPALWSGPRAPRARSRLRAALGRPGPRAPGPAHRANSPRAARPRRGRIPAAPPDRDRSGVAPRAAPPRTARAGRRAPAPPPAGPRPCGP